MAKIKRFASNGYVTNEDSNSGMKEARDADDLDRAMKMAEVDSDSPKRIPKSEITVFNEKTGVKGDSGNRVVSKKELADSGLSLRDFLNKERGRVRRGEPAAKSASKAEEPAGQIPGQSAKAPESSGGERSTERSRNIEAALGATGLGLGAAAAFKSLKAMKAARDAKKPMEAVAKQASEVAAKGREEVTNPLMWMAGPKKASKFKEPKKGMSEADTSGGAVGYKRGGGVSSASSRADGIAQRGRTKGRMY